MSADAARSRRRWAGAWLDALGFGAGLALAWIFDWSATDLIWSLWLSSFVVGYAMIVWLVTAPGRELLATMASDPSPLPRGPAAITLTLFGGGTLFMLGFFTIHFGGFHFVHSAFISGFFPLESRPTGAFPSWALYGEVFRRYWWFLPAAALAEREAFRNPALMWGSKDEAADGKTPRPQVADGNVMLAPYRNVARMHLLIFFFAIAHLARLDHFIVYAVAYAVYFFPWRLLKRSQRAAPAA